MNDLFLHSVILPALSAAVSAANYIIELQLVEHYMKLRV